MVADALSRPDISAIFLPTIDYRQLAADQATSEEITAYKTSITGLRFDDVQFDDYNLLELACQQLDLALASKQDPTIGGVSFSKYSTALKTLSELEEEMKDKEKAVQTVRELVAYLLISVPDAMLWTMTSSGEPGQS